MAVMEGLTCTSCGSADIFALQPGQDPERHDRLSCLLDAGAPTVARCRVCLLRKFPALNREAARA